MLVYSFLATNNPNKEQKLIDYIRHLKKERLDYKSYRIRDGVKKLEHREKA